MENEMENVTVERDGAADLEFVGQLLAASGTSPDRGSSYFSGSPGRWTVNKLWQTEGGAYIVQTIGHTQWQDETTRYRAAICASEAEVISFFGFSDLAKDIYKEAGIDASQKVA